MDLAKKIKPNIIKVTDSEQLAQRTLEEFVAAAKEAIGRKGSFYVAISGGSTPAVFFKLLSKNQSDCQVDWNKVHLFWVDERCVPPGDEASNFRLATETFLKDIPIPSQNIHRVTGEESDYDKAARDYESTLLDVFGMQPGDVPELDLVLLGMGTDGHIASLFPNNCALFDNNNLVSPVYLMDGNYSRITLTVPMLRQAHKLIVLVSGQSKSDIVREVFQTEPDIVKYPVHSLWPILDKVLWIVDEPAGTHLG